jgi:hypothetical protein
VSRIEGNGKRSLRRPKLSTIKGNSAPGSRRRMLECDIRQTDTKRFF